MSVFHFSGCWRTKFGTGNVVVALEHGILGGFHGGQNVDCVILGCDEVCSLKLLPTFRGTRHLHLQSSAYKNTRRYDPETHSLRHTIDV